MLEIVMSCSSHRKPVDLAECWLSFVNFSWPLTRAEVPKDTWGAILRSITRNVVTCGITRTSFILSVCSGKESHLGWLDSRLRDPFYYALYGSTYTSLLFERKINTLAFVTLSLAHRHWWDTLMILTIAAGLIAFPYQAAFDMSRSDSLSWTVVKNTLILLCCCDIVINFLTG